MSDLRKAAEAVLERWDSPAWEWMKQGPTAELMAALRTALAAPEPESKTPAWWVDGLIVTLMREGVNKHRAREIAQGYWEAYCQIPGTEEDIEALRRDAERLKADNKRLRGLLTDASKAVWMNYDGDLLDRIEAALKEVPR